MLYKQIALGPQDNFYDMVVLHQNNGHFIKSAGEISPEIAAVINGIVPEPGKTYVKLAALGAGEYYGPNRNGDYFPEEVLKNHHKTFLDAKLFKHHVNKDPKKSYGDVMSSHWNPKMKRVELIIVIDNKKAPDTVEKIASGDFPDCSMGCKVPWDECSICHNRATKVANYCGHLKTAMNQITDNGDRVYAINITPRFFDISEVFRGADRTAKMLSKVASTDTIEFVGLSVVGDDSQIDTQPVQVDPYIAKIAEDFCEKYLPIIEAYEPTLPISSLDKVANYDVGDSLSTLCHLGIVLKPQEYQYIMLKKAGFADEARSLFINNQFFSTEGISVPTSFSDEDVELVSKVASHKLARDLAPYVEHRSALQPHFSKRIVMILKSPADGKSPEPKPLPEATAPSLLSILSKLGVGYLVYKALASKFGLPSNVGMGSMAASGAGIYGVGRVAESLAKEKGVEQHMDTPIVTQYTDDSRRFSGLPSTLHEKTAAGISSGIGKFLRHPASHVVALPLAGVYAARGYVTHKARKGEPISGLERFVAVNPDTATIIAGGGILAHKASRTDVGQKLIKKILGRITKTGSLLDPQDVVRLADKVGDELAAKLAFEFIF